MRTSYLILPSLLKPLGTSLVNFLSLIHQPQSWKCYGHYSLPVFQQTITSGRAGMIEKDWFVLNKKPGKQRLPALYTCSLRKNLLLARLNYPAAYKVVCSSFSWMFYIPIYMTPTNNRSKKNVFTEVRATWFQLEYNAYPSSLTGNPTQISSTFIFSPGLVGKVGPWLEVLFNCFTSENLFTCYSPAKVQGYTDLFLLVCTKGWNHVYISREATLSPNLEDLQHHWET